MIGERPIFSGELHYPRIPRAYWRHRLQMARAMGLNAISTYIFWNVHQPREDLFDFEEGNDAGAFMRIAQEEGLDVIVRPGPYVCAEWDLGGLPAWLLRDGPIPLRTTDPAFMMPVRSWMKRLGAHLAPLHRDRGGPIIAVQLENEYGAFGEDKAYLRGLRDLLLESGFDGLPFYTIDQPGDVARGSLEGIPAALTFAPGDAGAQMAKLRAFRPEAPLVCGEYWAGWFDHWGEPRAQLDDDVQVRDLRWMLENGAGFNLYMFHGGSNFGLWNGANAFDPHRYQPTVSSYDYQAALDEAGHPAPKYHQFRSLLACAAGREPPPVPQSPELMAIAPFALDTVLALDAGLAQPVLGLHPLCMEACGQSLGFMLYRARLNGPREGVLRFERIDDYAVVRVDGKVAGHLDRRMGQTEITVGVTSGTALLEVLVENGGRINYGPLIGGERKGVAGNVSFCGEPVLEWAMHAIEPHTPPALTARRSSGLQHPSAPSFLCGSFELDCAADTFFDLSELRKGVVWINGHCIGRYWDVGPQRSLYAPAPWLRPGRNDLIALELFDVAGTPHVRGGTSPVWSHCRP